MNTVEILKAARGLIAYEAHWTRGALARDAAGCELADPRSESAARWCSLGAVLVVARNSRQRDYAIAFLGQAMGGTHRKIVPFNDDPKTTHADAISAFDRAIVATGAA